MLAMRRRHSAFLMPGNELCGPAPQDFDVLDYDDDSSGAVNLPACPSSSPEGGAPAQAPAPAPQAENDAAAVLLHLADNFANFASLANEGEDACMTATYDSQVYPRQKSVNAYRWQASLSCKL